MRFDAPSISETTISGVTPTRRSSKPGDEARVVLIHRRDEAAGIGMTRHAHREQPQMRFLEHVADPRGLRERGAQPLALVAAFEHGIERGVHRAAVAADPFGLAAVQRKHERAADAVLQRLRVIVRKIGDRQTGRIADERNRGAVGTERRARHREPVTRARPNASRKRLAPRRFFARVMDLIEHDDRRRAHEIAKQPRRGRDLLIGDDRTVRRRLRACAWRC